MIAAHAGSLILYTWVALGLVWLAGMFSTKRTVRAQSPGSRSLHLLLMLPGYALLAFGHFGVGWLGERFVPATSTAALVGLGITLAGCLFAAWARLTLGANWSGRVTLKQDHQLVTSGPYAFARHPIYTGLITAATGTALAVGQWRCVLGVVLITAAFLSKIHQEEPVMLEAFPDAYPAYRKRVKALFPGIY
jgi:protein-S-isoprenylcysteine O-methyltransferase Ste14